MNLLPINAAAKLKGASLATTNQAVVSGKIHKKEIDGTPYILINRAFENWKPGGKK